MFYHPVSKYLTLKTIGSKVIASMIVITLGILVLTITFLFIYSKVLEETNVVSQSDIPRAILSASMLDEIDDMYANVLGYTMGTANSQNDFEKNRIEFRAFMNKLKRASVSNIDTVEEIEILFNDYLRQVRKDIFSRYDPEEEAWAEQRVQALVSYTGKELESLLNTLKQSEIDDSRRAVFTKLRYEDDLAGVRFYLELVNEAGDMVANLSQYIHGDENAKNIFIKNSQNFEQFLSQLKPYEKKDSEMVALKRVTSLFRVLRDGGFEVIRRYNPVDKQQAIKSIKTTNSQLFYRLETLLDKLALEATNTANASLKSMRDDIEKSRYVFSFLLLFVFVVCLLLTYFSYKTVLRPLSDLSLLLKKLSEGNVNIDLVHTHRNDEIGEIAVAIEVFRNSLVTRNKVEKELVKAKEKAESASRAKADFLASMSHEIRTPMNGVLGLIELLSSSSLNPNQLHMVDTIEYSANSLLNIINDILDFSKIEAGKLELNNIPFNIIETIECVIDTLTINAETNNVKLELFTDPNIPQSLLSDPVRIKQILINLIGNAIKFSTTEKQQGVVRIELNLLATHSELVEIEFAIFDNGIGIKKEDLSQLFTPFVQAESSISRRFGGTGLGLSICQTLAELLKGRISASSQVGKGSTFRVSLPIKPLSPALIFKPSKEIVIFYLIESDWLRLCIDKYLTFNKIKYKALASDELNQHVKLLASGQSVIRLTDDKSVPLVEKNIIDSSSNVQAINYVVFDHKKRQEQFLSENIFTISCQPCLRITTLIHAINVLLGDEIPIELDSVAAIEDCYQAHSNENMENAEYLILVVEDNKTNQQVISRQIHSLGYNCLLANDGIEAESIYQKHDFDLVLTDCHMPNRDGYELAKVLRGIQAKGHHKPPIIAISADAITGTDKKCIDAGMDDYIAKPAKLLDLQAMLLHWLKPKANSSLEDGKFLKKIELNNTALYEIYGGNISHYIAGLEDYLVYCLKDVYWLSQLKNQSQAYDFRDMEEVCHTLKSSSKMIGATHLSSCVEKIETASKVQDCAVIDIQLDEIINLSTSIEKHIRSKLDELYSQTNHKE